MAPLFRDRTDAGRQLAAELRRFADAPNLLVLGIPRGGVVVAFEIAQALGAPLDVFVVRKLGVPGHEELAMGATAGGGLYFVDPATVEAYGVSPEAIQAVLRKEEREVQRRDRLYGLGLVRPPVAGRTVLLVDDGLATGASALAALRTIRPLGPARLVLAVPVAPADTLAEFRMEVDEIVCLATPDPFVAIGRSYAVFDDTSDAEVCRLLRDARARGFPVS